MAVAVADRVHSEKAQHLARLARRLEPAPTRRPYYLSMPGSDPAERARGWYLIPGDRDYPLFLGSNVFDAADFLRSMSA